MTKRLKIIDLLLGVRYECCALLEYAMVRSIEVVV